MNRTVNIPQLTIDVDTGKDHVREVFHLKEGEDIKYVVLMLDSDKSVLDTFLDDCESGAISPQLLLNFAMKGFLQTSNTVLATLFREAGHE
jgi:hypothetical protein